LSSNPLVKVAVPQKLFGEVILEEDNSCTPGG